MLAQVFKTCCQRARIGAVKLPPWGTPPWDRGRAPGGNQHAGIGEEAAQTAFLYQEIFSAPRSAPKLALRYAVVRKAEGMVGGYYAVAAVGDVGKAGPP